MARRPLLRIGCSGWNYKHWRGTFYPAEHPAHRWLEHYIDVFDTVEVNNTFYRLPETTVFESWRAQTYPGFLFTIKASRFLTHLKRLREPQEPLARLFGRAHGLGPRLGPVLYQLPGNFHCDLRRLEDFLVALPRRLPREGDRPAVAAIRHVMEFRHPSWYVPEAFALLNAHGVALCLHDKRGSKITEPWAGPFAYVRFHGKNGAYWGSYGDEAIDRWAHRLAEQWQDGRPVFAYFNNDPGGVAPRDAMRLRHRIAQITGVAI